MGKFAKSRKVGEVSEKGRAARRASPTSTVDKANTSTKASDYSPNTAGTKDAGVSKKRTPTKRMTRAQRLRQEKGFERADRNIDVLQVKRTKSLVREKRTKDRAGDWEDLNKKYVSGLDTKATNPFHAIQEDDGNDDWMSDEGPDELKAANKSTISAKNLSRFNALPEGSEIPAVSGQPAVPAPDVFQVDVDVDDIDEVL